MPDLITIQGNLTAVRGLTGVAGLRLIDETASCEEGSDTVRVAAFADTGAQGQVSGLGLTVVVVKTEAQYLADEADVRAAVNDTPYDFSGNV